MNKRIFIFILFLINCVISCSCQNRNEKVLARRFWRTEVIPNYKKNDIIMKVDVVRDADTSNTYSYIMLKREDTIIYVNHTWQVHFQFTPSNVKSVNTLNKELMNGKKGEPYYEVMYEQYIEGEVEYFRPLFFPKEYEKIDFVKMYDTLINNIPYKIICRNMKNGFYFNKETGKYDIPDFYTIYYYFNTNANSIDHIIAQPLQVDNNAAWPIEFFLDCKYKMTTSENSIFDFSNPLYTGYSRHDDSFAPYSWTFSIPHDSVLSDTVLEYPIIDLKNDTTTLSAENGWILLDFWFFQCPGCREQFSRWLNEKDSVGQIIIEKEGIKIMAINATSNNVNELYVISKQYELDGKVFYAKGLGNVLDMHIMPQYYLVSPDKKILLKTNSIEDYNSLITLKKTYEARTNH